MLKIKYLCILIIFSLPQIAYNQIDHQFIQNAYNGEHGGCWSVDICPNGTIVTSQSSGLWAYNYDGSNFINDVCIDSNAGARDVAIGSDGTIYFVNDATGLWAYKFESGSYSNTAYYNIYGAIGVAVSSDSTVFITYHGKLEAYKYQGNSFNYITYTWVTGSGSAWGVNVDPDNTIFLTSVDFDCGLAAYDFNGTTFTQIAHIYTPCNPLNSTLGPDGTVLLSMDGRGLCAYYYNGTSFTMIGNVDNGGAAKKAITDSTGTIFLANGSDGLRSYNFIDSTFINTAHINGDLHDITISSDSIIFVADKSEGLLAYTYSTMTNIDNDDLNILQNEYRLTQNYPNPFNPITTISYQLPTESYVELIIFDINGYLVKKLVDKSQQPGYYSIQWDATGNSSGVYLYHISTESFKKTGKCLLMK